jgi:hypothetical protein
LKLEKDCEKREWKKLDKKASPERKETGREEGVRWSKLTD